MRSGYGSDPTRLSPERAIADLAARQHGVFSRAQALGAGASKSLLQRRVSAGLWDRIAPGVYRSASSARTWKQELMAACLCWGPGVAISHRAAACLWALPGFPPGCVELSVPRGRRRGGAGTIHRPATLPAIDVTTIGSLPVTTAARTLIDVAAVVPRSLLEEALDDALRRSLVSPSRLRWRLEEIGSKGRGGTRALNELLEQRIGTSVPQSVFETKLLRMMRRAGLPRPEIQHQVRDRGRLIAIVDFAFPEQRVAIEADGYRWHSGQARWSSDLRRRNALTARGWRTVHVTWWDLSGRPDAILEQLRLLLGG